MRESMQFEAVVAVVRSNDGKKEKYLFARDKSTTS